MEFDGDQHVGRLQVRRAELREIDDSGDMQRATVEGYADEIIKGAHRVQPFGYSSNPPAGSHGLIMQVNGRPDQAVILGVENGSKRPRNLPPGASMLYDGAEGMVFLDGDGNLHADVKKAAIIKAKSVTLEAETITLKGNVVYQP